MIAQGRVLSVDGSDVHAVLPGARVGARVFAGNKNARRYGVINAVSNGRIRFRCDTGAGGLAPGDDVSELTGRAKTRFGTALLGHSIDAPFDVLLPEVPSHNDRTACTDPLWTGVRAVDGLLTIARGARIGLFGPPGAGKSSLLQTIAAHSCADAIVVGLTGERGREAQAWAGAVSPHKTVVCATSDRTAGERVASAHAAMAQAAALRARGLEVLLIVDSLARYAGALREIALSAGEPVGRGGYPPSVFANLARYVEVAGCTNRGSLTLIATVLSDGDERDPLSDAARSLLDGHLQLSSALAARGHYPAIDVLASASRTMASVASEPHREAAAIVRAAIFALARSADARSLGLETDEVSASAAACEPAIDRFLTQRAGGTDASETLSSLYALADILR